VAVLGPALATVKVNVTTSPGVMLPLPSRSVFRTTVLNRLRSDTRLNGGVTLDWSSSPGSPLFGVESGSKLLDAVTCAVLVYAPLLLTVAVISKVRGVLVVTLPTVHTPVAGTYVPAPLSLYHVYPDGSWSVTWTPVAVAGPALETVSTNRTRSPAVIVPLASASKARPAGVRDGSKTFVRLKSEMVGDQVSSSFSVVELLPGVLLGSNTPERVTWA